MTGFDVAAARAVCEERNPLAPWEFTRAARTLLPQALDEVERLQSDLRAARTTIDGMFREAEVERSDAVAEVATLRAALGRVLIEHWQTTTPWGGKQRLACGRCTYGDGVPFLWPCPTRQAITGEAAPQPDSRHPAAVPPAPETTE